MLLKTPWFINCQQQIFVADRRRFQSKPTTTVVAIKTVDRTRPVLKLKFIVINKKFLVVFEQNATYDLARQAPSLEQAASKFEISFRFAGIYVAKLHPDML